MVSQRLSILPCGVIRGGTVGFSCHPTTGELYYVGEIYVRKFIFTRRHRFHGSLQLNPLNLKSESIAKGLVVHFRAIKLSVENRYDHGCEVIFDFHQAHPGTGTAVFDLSGKYVRLKRATGSGVVRNSNLFGRHHVCLMVEDGD